MGCHRVGQDARANGADELLGDDARKLIRVVAHSGGGDDDDVHYLNVLEV